MQRSVSTEHFHLGKLHLQRLMFTQSLQFACGATEEKADLRSIMLTYLFPYPHL